MKPNNKKIKKVGDILSDVVIIMGSSSDIKIAKKAVNIFEEFGISYDITVASAHRTSERVRDITVESTKNGTKVFIAIAGLAAHLPGIVKANTTRPVIGVPVESKLNGLDALLACVQTPKGVPVATVGIDRGENAAILAAQIIGIHDKNIRKKVLEYKSNMVKKIEGDQEYIRKEIGGKYLIARSYGKFLADVEEKFKIYENKNDEGEDSVLIVAGSYSDIKIVESIVEILKSFDIQYKIEIASPNRYPQKLHKAVVNGTVSGTKVFICVSGLSGFVSGAVAAHTDRPVISVPHDVKLGGLDSLITMAQMPPGVPTATVGIDNGKNAAILAVEMLAVNNEELKEKLTSFRKNLSEMVDFINTAQIS